MPHSTEAAEGGRERLESVRAELRQRGYLSHRYERYMLQDAWRPRRPLPVLLRLAIKVALAGGSAIALAAAMALAVANGSLAQSPFDLIVLFVHLLVPAAFVLGAGFLGLAVLVVLVLWAGHVRRIEILSSGAALAAGALAVAAGLWGLRDLWWSAPRWQLALLAVAVPLAVYAAVKVLESGLLSLAIKLTDRVPRRRLFSRRWLAAATLLVLFLLTLPAVLAVRGEAPEPPVNLPESTGERVVLIGVDGVLAQELDYHLALGDLPRMAALRRGVSEGSGLLARYRRPPGPPAVFWSTVATGRSGTDHGLTSLDSFMPLGASTPLARTGPSRPYWRYIAVPLGLAEYRPLLSNRRRAFTIWELAARGGFPALAVNWWGTFPAEPLPGLVVAHGAYQLLQDSSTATAAVATESSPAAGQALQERLAQRAARTTAGPFAPPLTAALAPPLLDEALQRAVLPDRFYVETFVDEAVEARPDSAPRAAALYLPGLDLLADRWPGHAGAFADLVRLQLAEVDRLVGELADSRAEVDSAPVGTVAVVFDPGRRSGSSEGRIFLWRRSGCGPAKFQAKAPSGRSLPRIRPPEVASALLRALGLPQSRELPPPPRGCEFPPPPDELPTYGDRPFHEPAGGKGGEYLESLRSLGYL